jgi:hypothetical protein
MALAISSGYVWPAKFLVLGACGAVTAGQLATIGIPSEGEHPVFIIEAAIEGLLLAMTMSEEYLGARKSKAARWATPALGDLDVKLGARYVKFEK